MYSVTTLILTAIFVELFRRFCIILITAFTGPLSKIPGPFVGKFTSVPWIYQVIRGNQMNIGPKLFRKYGDVVRIGKYYAPRKKVVGGEVDEKKVRKISFLRIRLAFRRSLWKMIWENRRSMFLLCPERGLARSSATFKNSHFSSRCQTSRRLYGGLIERSSDKNKFCWPFGFIKLWNCSRR